VLAFQLYGKYVSSIACVKNVVRQSAGERNQPWTWAVAPAIQGEPGAPG
jgi:hypothetical protein